MLLNHDPTKILITGASGTGKSTYWTKLILGYPARYKFVFDHEGELQIRLKIPAAVDPQGLAEGLSRGWCIFDPVRMYPGNLPAAFAFFCDFAFEASSRLKGTKLFACDELQKLVNFNQVQCELSMVLETGRRHQLDGIMVAQAPNLIHNRIRNQITEVVTFQHIDKRAMEFLLGVGFDEQSLRALKPGGFLARNLRSGQLTKGYVFA